MVVMSFVGQMVGSGVAQCGAMWRGVVWRGDAQLQWPQQNLSRHAIQAVRVHDQTV